MTVEITPEAREVLSACYEIVLQAAARRRARLERQNEQAASDQVGRLGALAARPVPQLVGTVPNSTTA